MAGDDSRQSITGRSCGYRTSPGGTFRSQMWRRDAATTAAGKAALLLRRHFSALLWRLFFLLTDSGAEFGDDFPRGFDGCGVLVHVEGDCAYAGVAAAAVTLADAGEVHFWRLRRPGIRSHGNLHAETALTQSDAVDRFRVE